ncbi:hypothetical protein [Streptomyces sp. bgisy091]|uniref:hypothetical protein n=1 Tax=Streptomyces sp. bgisy091 TaxID=3413778 RepID=UPI003D7320A0
MRDDSERTWPFDLKITEKVPNASGDVRIRNTWLVDPELPFDTKPANNTAKLVLNGDGSGSGDPGGSSDGSTGTGGSTGGDTEGSGTTGSPDAGSASGSAGSTGTSGSASSDADGDLASTGSAVLMSSAIAAAALAAGGVLYVTARRQARRA